MTAKRPLVLIVDDDSDQLELGRALAVQAGFTVMTAASGSEALSAARARRPDAVLSDVLMGEMDGFTFCSQLRSDPILRDVPVVLMSAYFHCEEDQELATSAGALEIVERTPMFEAEIAALRRALEAGSPPFAERGPLPSLYVRTMANRLAQFLEQTHNAELRYRTLLDHANDAIAILTKDGIILEVNHRWEEIRQLPRERLIGQHVREFAAPGHADFIVAAYDREVASSGRRSPPMPIGRADGSTVYMEFSTTPVEIGGETLVFTVGRDLTDTLEASKRLEASERRHRLLIENIPDVVWVATLEGKVIFISSRVLEVCGFTSDEVTSSDASFWFDRIHPDHIDRVRRAYTSLSPAGYEAEYRWQRKDGQWIWIRSRAVAATDENGDTVAQGTFADVTEQQRLEDMARQSQKMEAIGQLTGGVAHDFNNLLAIILGNGRMLLDDLDEADPRRVDAEAVVEAGERAATMTRQLLTFSRRQVVQPKRLNLNSIVMGVEKMFRRLIGEDIELSISLADDSGAVFVDAGEIEQVIMNLVANARDAMPAGGKLSIETMNVDLDEHYTDAHVGLVPGTYVMLSVTDTGCGMDAETRRRAFEPFFTTKGPGRGTGLGLSTCYGIVQQNKGHIAIYSEVGHGTVFKVYLPRVDGLTLAAAPAAPAAPDATGSETVLLIEDDDLLRKTILHILASRGYTVLQSASGEEALAVCEQHVGPIHLVLSDMIMPGLNGPDTASRVRMRRPATKVLFMSGYSDHALLRDGSVEAGVNFIQKPFAPRALAVKIREVLNGS